MNIKDLHDIYKELPRIRCKGLCTESCGPIVYGDVERRNIEQTHGKGGLPEAGRGLTCNQLVPSGRCKIYNQRPLICRLFGVAKGLECPHGCVPESVLSKRKARKLLDKVVTDSRTRFQKRIDENKS